MTDDRETREIQGIQERARAMVAKGFADATAEFLRKHPEAPALAWTAAPDSLTTEQLKLGMNALDVMAGGRDLSPAEEAQRARLSDVYWDRWHAEYDRRQREEARRERRRQKRETAGGQWLE